MEKISFNVYAGLVLGGAALYFAKYYAEQKNQKAIQNEPA